MRLALLARDVRVAPPMAHLLIPRIDGTRESELTRYRVPLQARPVSRSCARISVEGSQVRRGRWTPPGSQTASGGLPCNP